MRTLKEVKFIINKQIINCINYPRLHISVAVVQYVALITSGAMNSRVPSIPHRSFSVPPSSFASPKSIILRNCFEKSETINNFLLLDCQVVLISGGEQDVVRFDVHVNHSEPVDVDQSIQHLRHNQATFRLCQLKVRL